MSLWECADEECFLPPCHWIDACNRCGFFPEETFFPLKPAPSTEGYENWTDDQLMDYAEGWKICPLIYRIIHDYWLHFIRFEPREPPLTFDPLPGPALHLESWRVWNHVDECRITSVPAKGLGYYEINDEKGSLCMYASLHYDVTVYKDHRVRKIRAFWGGPFVPRYKYQWLRYLHPDAPPPYHRGLVHINGFSLFVFDLKNSLMFHVRRHHPINYPYAKRLFHWVMGIHRGVYQTLEVQGVSRQLIGYIYLPKKFSGDQFGIADENANRIMKTYIYEENDYGQKIYKLCKVHPDGGTRHCATIKIQGKRMRKGWFRKGKGPLEDEGMKVGDFSVKFDRPRELSLYEKTLVLSLTWYIRIRDWDRKYRMNHWMDFTKNRHRHIIDETSGSEKFTHTY